MFKIFTFILISIVLLTESVFSQDIKRYQSIVAYVNNFCKYTEWNDENISETFNIVLLSDNKDLISTFEVFANQKEIKKKKINLLVQSKPVIDTNTNHLIFIDKDKLYYYFYLFKLIDGKNILLISENYDDQRFVMINLFDSDDGRLLFEINKSNIINQGLTIAPEILLLGGSEIDVAELYRTSQITLLSMEIELQNSKNQIDSINKQIPALQNDILEREKQINAQNALMLEKEKRISAQEVKVEELNANILSKEYLLNYQLKQLKVKNDSLAQKNILLTAQENLFTEQKIMLDEQQAILEQKYEEIEKMDAEINQKNEILGIQDVKIDKQRNVILLFGLIVILTVVLASVLLIFYRNKKLLNLQLTQKKNQIEKINQELNESNEELTLKNEQLNNANNKLSSALEQLKQTQVQLVQSEKMASLGILTAGIAHEINNPINFVYTGINSLNKDFDDLVPILDEIKKLTPENKENHSEIISNIIKLKEKYYFEEAYSVIPLTIKDIRLGADRTAEIVRGMRNFSVSDKQAWEFFDIHKSIETTLILLKNTYKNRIEITKSFKEDLPMIQCLPGKINQIFMNIVKNAVDAIPDKGKIHITTTFDDNFVRISFLDNGTGIDESIKSKLFDPFFTTKQVGKGVGLGLSITYGIIKEHNGTIDVKSQVGKGSEFIIKLPINQKEQIINNE